MEFLVALSKLKWWIKDFNSLQAKKWTHYMYFNVHITYGFYLADRTQTLEASNWKQFTLKLQSTRCIPFKLQAHLFHFFKIFFFSDLSWSHEKSHIIFSVHCIHSLQLLKYNIIQKSITDSSQVSSY